MNVLRRLCVYACAAAGFLAVVIPLSAHHSQAMYEPEKLVTIEGVITKFRWMNPHVWIHLDVTDAQGKVEPWEIETNAAVSMKKLGWSRKQFTAGERVTITASPRKDGSSEGMLRKVVFPDGKEFSMPGNGPQRPR